jgi:predicted kinase
MSHLFVMVGLPGAGKTTLAESIEGVTVISTDALRQQGLSHKEVFRTFYSLVDGELWEDRSVIADSTGLTVAVRERLITIAWERDAQCHAIVFPDAATAYQRNLKRERVMPPEAMDQLREQLREAQRLLEHEGFQTITKVWAGLEELVANTIRQFVRETV